MNSYQEPTEHPGLWLKETFKGDRTYYQWLVEDVNKRFDPLTHNINPQYHWASVRNYLNGRNGLDPWKARALAAAVPISISDLMKKHAEYEIALLRWQQTNFRHYTDKNYIGDLDKVPEYFPEHRNFKPTF